jgi:hypothetical protein
VKSKLHPCGVARMCSNCAHWAWEGEGMQPAAERVDGVWQCANRVDRHSVPVNEGADA